MDGSNPKRGAAAGALAHAVVDHEHGLSGREGSPRDFAGELVENLLQSYRTASGSMQHVNSYELPSMEEVATIVKLCRTLLFPGFEGQTLVRATDTELREFVR